MGEDINDIITKIFMESETFKALKREADKLKDECISTSNRAPRPNT